ncbi:MAG: 7TM diverse intracellular signaling domain-containing protein, partial [Chitinophagaceae bacterium]
MVKYYCFFLLLLCFSKANSTEKIIITNELTTQLISSDIYYIEDASGKLSFNDIVRSPAFRYLDNPIVNFQVSGSVFWLKITIANKDNAKKNFIEVIQPLLNVVDFYDPIGNGNYKLIQGGQRFTFESRQFLRSTNFLFELDLRPGEERTYYLRIKGHEQIFVPLQLITENSLNQAISNRTLWFGMYCGIILVMVLYNFFIYLSTRDISYLYYVLHTLFVGLTQGTLLGFTYKYLWPNLPWFGNYSNFLFTSLVSIVGVQFLIEFMHLKASARVIFKVLKAFQVLYVIYIFTSLSGFYSVTYGAILATQSVIAIFILIISIYLYKRGFAEAKYYLIGWSSLMLGLILYVSMNYGLLPYNNLTAYSLLFGSAAEITLLSFALADKINIYKSDKEKSQEQALNALKENERMVREQNIYLENTVEERTLELRIVNNDLNKVLRDLKEAEGHLVESEKMAALGQLTAGIAHEINNPINFVTSNISPLKRDVDILLEMIENLEEVGLSELSQADKVIKIEEYKEELDFDYLKT